MHEINSNRDLLDVDIQSKKIVEERDKSYGDSWKTMSLEQIMGEIEQKVNRIRKMPKSPERLEQAFDIVNYSRFLSYRILHGE